MSSSLPIGTPDTEVFYGNSIYLDFLVNGPDDEYPDRFGNMRLSWEGIVKRMILQRTFVEGVVLDTTGVVAVSSNVQYPTPAGFYPKALRFMGPGIVTIGDEWKDGSKFSVTVDHTVPVPATACLLMLNTGVFNTVKGTDSTVKLAAHSKEFVFEKIAGSWRIS